MPGLLAIKSAVWLMRPRLLMAALLLSVSLRTLADDPAAPVRQPAQESASPVSGRAAGDNVDDVEVLQERAEQVKQRVADHYRHGRFRDAIAAAEELAEIRKRLLGGQNLRYAVVLNNLGELYRNQGEFDRAEGAYRDAERILAACCNSCPRALGRLSG